MRSRSRCRRTACFISAGRRRCCGITNRFAPAPGQRGVYTPVPAPGVAPKRSGPHARVLIPVRARMKAQRTLTEAGAVGAAGVLSPRQRATLRWCSSSVRANTCPPLRQRRNRARSVSAGWSPRSGSRGRASIDRAGRQAGGCDRCCTDRRGRDPTRVSARSRDAGAIAHAIDHGGVGLQLHADRAAG